MQHLESFKLSHFQAFNDRFPTPRKIPKGRHCIELITGGCVIYDEEEEEISCRMGAIFWHKEGEQTIYRFAEGEPYSCLVVDFAMEDPQKRDFPRLTFWDKPVEVSSFCKEVLKCYFDDHYDRKIINEYIFRKIYWQAYFYSRTESVLDLPMEIKKAISFINDNNGMEINVAAISKEVGVSVPHLHFLFKKHLDDSPHNYLLFRRLQKARHLLATTYLPVKQICSDCGFGNLENFCRRFKKFTKMTPSQYRDKHTVPY